MKNPRGGARPGAGRHKVGRRQLTVRIKADILDMLGRNAARTVRELVEQTYEELL